MSWLPQNLLRPAHHPPSLLERIIPSFKSAANSPTCCHDQIPKSGNGSLQLGKGARAKGKKPVRASHQLSIYTVGFFRRLLAGGILAQLAGKGRLRHKKREQGYARPLNFLSPVATSAALAFAMGHSMFLALVSEVTGHK